VLIGSRPQKMPIRPFCLPQEPRDRVSAVLGSSAHFKRDSWPAMPCAFSTSHELVTHELSSPRTNRREPLIFSMLLRTKSGSVS
jgi:hypothetical protein